MNKYVLMTAAALIASMAVADYSRLAEVDSDGDGAISLAEFENAGLERARERFARLDADSNGSLTADEVSRPERDRRGKRDRRRFDPERIVERLDADDSGSLSMVELDGARSAPDAGEFAAADADGNGELNGEEVGALMKERHKAWRSR